MVSWLAACTGLLSGGHINLETPVWREGEASWLPIKEVVELKPVVQVVKELQEQTKKK
jgi:hypothetical protein